MEETIIVIMVKDPKTGFLENEIENYKIKEYDEYLYNAYALKEEEKILIYLKISTSREVEDWEYSAIYDFYDEEVFEELDLVIKEDLDGYNPMWEIEIPMIDDKSKMEDIIGNILKLHNDEINRIMEIIPEYKEDYIE